MKETSDANIALGPSRLSLSFAGVWPNSRKTSPLRGTISNFAFTISIFMIGYFIVSVQTIEFFLKLGRGDLDILVDVLCIADIPAFVSLVKLIFLRLRSEEVRSLLSDFYGDWARLKPRERPMMLKNAKASRRFAVVIVALGHATCVLFLIGRHAVSMAKVARTGERTALFQSHFYLLDYGRSPGYELTWGLQSLAAICATFAFSGFDSFFEVLVMHLCGQFTLLINEIKYLSDRDDFRRSIADIVRRHDRLNRHVKKIEKTFSWVLLANVAACVVQMCLQGYQFFKFSEDESVTYPVLHISVLIIYILYISFDIYIYCHVGEQLRIKSVELSDEVYNYKWFRLKKHKSRDLMFILQRAQSPFQIKAGKLFVLSAGLFMDIAKTSVGYLSILLAVRRKNHITTHEYEVT